VLDIKRKRKKTKREIKRGIVAEKGKNVQMQIKRGHFLHSSAYKVRNFKDTKGSRKEGGGGEHP